MIAKLSLAAWLTLGLAGAAAAQELDPDQPDTVLPQQTLPPTAAPSEQPAPPPAMPPPAPKPAPRPPEERVTPQGYIRVEPGQAAEDAPAPPEDDEDVVPGSDGYSAAEDQAPPEGAENVDFQTFHDALSPYGQWVYTADYGWIWQPNGETDDWRPYSDGAWQWSAYGWTWCGSEPWAWAPYHYGRWVSMNGVGWGWVPGYTWGPAWVSWRTGPGYVGWTPLWPGWGAGRWGGWPINYAHWNFTPLNHFYGGRVGGQLLGAGAIPGIWGQTNFAGAFRSNGASFLGPQPGVVASGTGHAVTPVAIHPLTNVSDARLAGLHGNTLNVLAPSFFSAAHPFATNGRLANVPATASIGNRELAANSANRVAGTTPFRGALPNIAATRAFMNRQASGAGTFSTYHAPSVSNGYGSYGAYRGPSGNGYGSSYRAPSGSYSGGYHGGYSGGGPSYGGYHGGAYSGGYHPPQYGTPSGGFTSHPSSSSHSSFHSGGGGGGGRGGGGRR